jgi:orotidine-5'-phosphate decarboxylase
MKFITKLIKSLEESGSPLCVGLDSRLDKLPTNLLNGGSIVEQIFCFNKAVINATSDLCCAYKMNLAFYAAFGTEGLEALRKTTYFLKEKHPTLPIFADCKRSEMGESVKMVKQEIFEFLGFDCVMVTPWFGVDTVANYLDDERHGVMVYVHDSNPSATEFQDLIIQDPQAPARTLPLYAYVAERISKYWNTNGNVAVEAGLTYPKALSTIRKIVGEDMPILVAGLGPQGGNPNSLNGLFGKGKSRLFVNVSRAIIFPENPSSDYFTAVRLSAENIKALLTQAKAD